MSLFRLQNKGNNFFFDAKIISANYFADIIMPFSRFIIFRPANIIKKSVGNKKNYHIERIIGISLYFCMVNSYFSYHYLTHNRGSSATWRKIATGLLKPENIYISTKWQELANKNPNTTAPKHIDEAEKLINT